MASKNEWGQCKDCKWFQVRAACERREQYDGAVHRGAVAAVPAARFRE